MSKQVIFSLVEQFLASGGQVTKCQTMTAFGGGSPQRRIDHSGNFAHSNKEA